MRSTVVRVVAAATLGLLLHVGSAAAQEAVGSVAALDGRADAQHPGQATAVDLKPSDAVLLGDRLRTAVASKLKLLFRDDSVLTLAAESELTVTAEVVGPALSSSTFSLWIGTIRTLVTDRYKAPGSSFEVETPTAVAGVRGTGFIVRYDPARKTTLVVSLFDVVCVRPRIPAAGPEVCLTPRRFTEVRAGKPPSRAATIDARRLDALLEATEIPGGGVEPEKELGPSGGLKPDQRPPEAAVPAPPGSSLGQPDRSRDEALSPEGGVVDQPVKQLEKLLGKPTSAPPPPPPPPPPPGARSPGARR